MTASEVPREAEKGPGTDPAERRRARVAGLLVFLLALGVRLAFLAEIDGSFLEDERQLISDVGFYVERGEEIARGEIFGREPGYLSPIYCGFLAIVYACGGEMAAAKVVQAVLGAVTCLLVFQLARKLFDWRAGALAGTVFALYGMHVFYTGLLLPTVIVVLFNVAFLTLAVTGGRPPTLGRYLAAGAMLGLAIGSKPNALLMVPATMAWVLIGMRELGLDRRIRLVGCFFLGVVMTLAPVTWRNYQVSGEFVLVSVVGGRNLLKGNGPDADGSHVFLPPGQQGISLYMIRNNDVDPALAVADDRDKKRETYEYMRAHPWRTLRLFGKKLFLMFNAQELSIRDHFEFARTKFPVLGWLPFTFGIVVPIGMVGMVFTLLRRRFALVHLMIAAQVASFVLVFVLGRYRLVMVACLAVLAAGQVLCFVRAVRDRERRTIGWSAFLWAAFFVLSQLPAPGFPPDRGWADQYAYSALVHKTNERWAEALVDWVGALDTQWANPFRRLSDSEIYTEIARCHTRLERPEEARRALEAAEEAFNELGTRARPQRVRDEIEALYEELGGR